MTLEVAFERIDQHNRDLTEIRLQQAVLDERQKNFERQHAEFKAQQDKLVALVSKADVRLTAWIEESRKDSRDLQTKFEQKSDNMAQKIDTLIEQETKKTGAKELRLKVMELTRFFALIITTGLAVVGGLHLTGNHVVPEEKKQESTTQSNKQ
jgi:hypothetical protein